MLQKIQKKHFFLETFKYVPEREGALLAYVRWCERCSRS